MQSAKILHLFNQLNPIDQEEIHIICRYMAESMALDYDGNCGINTAQESEFWKWEADTWQEIKTYHDRLFDYLGP